MIYEGMASDDWFTRLKEAIAADGRSHKTISLAAGLGQNYVQQMIHKSQPPKLPTLDKLLEVLGPEVAVRVRPTSGPVTEYRESDIRLPTGMARDVPVLGTAAGSDFERGAFQITTDPVDYVRRPPGLLQARDVYALYVEGSSMEPRFEPGELIFINPNRPVRIGDYVVIQEPIADGEMRGFVKLLQKRTAEWVTVKQFNPPAEMQFRAEGLVLHRVMSMADLMGV